MSEKINSFDEWFNNHEFNHFKTGSHKERCEIAWTACAKMKDEEIERLKEELKDARSSYDHLSSEYRNLNKSLGDYKKENEILKLENKKAVNAFKELSRYLADGEHVDLCWVKDTIQLQAETETLVNAKHRIEIKKLQKENEELKNKSQN